MQRIAQLALVGTFLVGCASEPLPAPRSRPSFGDSEIGAAPQPAAPAPPHPLDALLRDLPASDAGHAAQAFAARLDALGHACASAHVDAGTPGTVRGDFGVDCPDVRGSVEASFADEAGEVHVELRLQDFWQRGGDVLDGPWSVVVTSAGEARFEGTHPGHDAPAPSRRLPIAPALPRPARGSGWALVPFVPVMLARILLQ